MKKILVIFDGSNFYHGVKRLSKNTHLSNFNYRKLSQNVTGSKDVKIEYCVGEIKQNHRSSKTRRLYAGQQALFYHLEKQGIKIQKGYMLKDGSTYHEKGVDVRIAIDILHGALKNTYDICYIISSDTDIIPAILDAKTEKKQVVYIGFKGFISRAMEANCSRTIILDDKFIKECSRYQKAGGTFPSSGAYKSEKKVSSLRVKKLVWFKVCG